MSVYNMSYTVIGWLDKMLKIPIVEIFEYSTGHWIFYAIFPDSIIGSRTYIKWKITFKKAKIKNDQETSNKSNFKRIHSNSWHQMYP